MEDILQVREEYRYSDSPLAAAAMIDLSRVEKYYVACGCTDLRRGIDGLAAIVSQQYGRDLCVICSLYERQ